MQHMALAMLGASRFIEHVTNFSCEVRSSSFDRPCLPTSDRAGPQLGQSISQVFGFFIAVSFVYESLESLLGPLDLLNACNPVLGPALVTSIRG